MMRSLLLILLLSVSTLAHAAPGVYEKSVQQPLDTVYDRVSKSLDDNGFYVVFEPDIGKNLSGMAEKWGKDYNRNKLEAIKSMVFCSGWYANAMSNADPSMLALCPLHVTLTHKAGKTTVLFLRPSQVAKGSKAEKLAKELEQAVIKALEGGLDGK
jgi:uncharacterized protein (DUF302 family)